ncbi:hypothetical protein PHYBOEH_009723 [Phytophthora boehmeriae]|uniref:RxLR effector protein n=1 Tax=Phytophthora boehmeriae TaxID=109152 RepID=A0A8T1VRG4_9STRA|nr:hypothetical protein PHYBOEH_009723 [Phytophthora boehmeriae]
MRFSCFLLATVVSLLAGTDVVSAATDIDHTKISSKAAVGAPLESTTEFLDHSAKRHLRAAKSDDDGVDASTTDEERLLINYVAEKLLAAGEQVARAVKPQKYQKWIAAGLSPSAVRVDVMKIPPWTKNRAVVLAEHPDFVQYAKFMVKHEKLERAKAIANAAT